MKLLIDGDVLLYRGGFSSQHVWYYVYVDQEEEDGWIAKFKYKKQADEWVNGQEDLIIEPKVEVDSLHLALYNVEKIIRGIVLSCRKYEQDIGEYDSNDNILIFFSDTCLERSDIATIQKYKGNRDNAPKPIWYGEIKEYLRKNYESIVLPKMEADDGMAIYADERSIICTPDKDLDMVAGKRWKDGKVYYISDDEARLSFYTQLLIGDATDNIPGLFKLTGQRASKKIKEGLFPLKTDKEMYEYVREIYMHAFGCNREQNDIDVVLLEIGNLLWMRRELNEAWKIPKD